MGREGLGDPGVRPLARRQGDSIRGKVSSGVQ